MRVHRGYLFWGVFFIVAGFFVYALGAAGYVFAPSWHFVVLFRVLSGFGAAGIFPMTLAYIAALTCAANAFNGGLSFAQVGAVYLGASLLAAAAPTPGGLGAMEAALVAGFTAIGMDGGIAVATVLSYRLATYWLPILPGWLSFRLLDRRSFI